MKIRQFLAFLLCSALLITVMPVKAAQSRTITVDPINVMVGGKNFLPTDANGKNVPVFAYNGTTYAPLRALAEAYGLDVGYNGEKNLATVNGTPSGNFAGSKGTAQAMTKQTNITVTPINIEVNGEVFQPKDANGKNVPVFAYNGTTYAPLRALAEAYGLTVGYDGTKNLATVEFVKNVNYDSIIDYYKIPFELGRPQYGVDEIQKMIKDKLTLDAVAQKISTLADAVQYLHQKGYGGTNGDLCVSYNGIEWHVNRSAQTVFNENKGNCGGGSNLLNYLLCGDFDEQGYVQESANEGGHVYNYFKQNDIYYFVDMVQIVHGGDYAHRSYEVFATSNPQEFSDYYIGQNKSHVASDEPTYLLFQCMYACDGSGLPIGSNEQCRTVLNRPFMNIIDKKIEGDIKILYVAEDKYPPIFKNAPDKAVWPSAAR